MATVCNTRIRIPYFFELNVNKEGLIRISSRQNTDPKKKYKYKGESMMVRVSLFITCICDSFYGNVGEAMVKILERQGVQVDFPEDQVCCGQPALNTGYWDDARVVAKNLIDAFKDSEYVVGPSGSCVSFIHEYYPIIFEKDPKYKKLAEDFIKKTYEFSQFLVEVLKVDDIGAKFPHKVTYHPNCHAMRFLGVNPSVFTLLNNVKDLDYAELPRFLDCCGFGGTFSVKLPEISEKIVDEKCDHILETGASVLVGTDMGCLMNIGGRLKKRGSEVRVMHIAELLLEGVQ